MAYMFAFVIIIFLQKIYFNNFWIFILFGNIWVPQIIKNSLNGYKNGPGLPFVICQTLHCVYVPMFFKFSSKNFLFLEPDYIFFA